MGAGAVGIGGREKDTGTGGREVPWLRSWELAFGMLSSDTGGKLA
jgi:hypothetical protein